jgi:hypothetical protein
VPPRGRGRRRPVTGTERLGARRWAPSERFVLSEQGVAIEARYRAGIVTARSTGGRASFDAARAAWSERFRLRPDDGVYLGELRDGGATLSEIVERLEVCGQTRKHAVETMTRLLDLGLVESMRLHSGRKPRL